MSAREKLLVSCKWIITSLAMLWCEGVLSQGLADPTRPAPTWLAAQPKVTGEIVLEKNAVPSVQMLLIGKSRKYAIIDGQIIKPGGNYNGSRVVAIKSGLVVLQGDDALQTLKMHPTIEKTIITHKPSAKTGRVTNSIKTVEIGESK